MTTVSPAMEYLQRALQLRDSGELEEAWNHLSEAEDLLREDCDDPGLPVLAIFVRASLQEERGDIEEAERNYRRALAGWEEVEGTDHIEFIKTLRALGNLKTFNDEYEEAIQLHATALKLIQESRGSHHPEWPVQMFMIANCHSLHGEWEEAKKAYFAIYNLAQEISEEGQRIGDDLREAIIGAAEHLAENEGQPGLSLEILSELADPMDRSFEPTSHQVVSYLISMANMKFKIEQEQEVGDEPAVEMAQHALDRGRNLFDSEEKFEEWVRRLAEGIPVVRAAREAS